MHKVNILKVSNWPFLQTHIVVTQVTWQPLISRCRRVNRTTVMLSMKTGINREYVHSPRGPKVNRTDRKLNRWHFNIEGERKKRLCMIDTVCNKYLSAWTYFDSREINVYINNPCFKGLQVWPLHSQINWYFILLYNVSGRNKEMYLSRKSK